METTRLEEQVCPHCGHDLDAHSGKNGAPDPGDISICFYCGELIVFSEYLSLIKCSEEYLTQIDEETLTTVRNIQTKIKAGL